MYLDLWEACMWNCLRDFANSLHCGCYTKGRSRKDTIIKGEGGRCQKITKDGVVGRGFSKDDVKETIFIPGIGSGKKS